MANDRRRDRDDDFDDDRPVRRRPRDERDEDDPVVSRSRAATPKSINIPGVVSLSLGIIGLILAAIPCTFFVGMPIAAITLIIGLVGMFTSRQTTGRGLPIAGICVSIAGLLAGGFWLGSLVIFAKKGQEKFEQAQVRMEAQVKEAQEGARLAQEKQQREEKELREGKAVSVTAETLYEDFDTKPLDADKKYMNKVVEVSGKIHRVDRDRFGRVAVELDAPGDGLIRCEFPREAQAQIDRLRPDQQVTIRGRCVGQSGKTVVKVESCLLVTRGK